MDECWVFVTNFVPSQKPHYEDAIRHHPELKLEIREGYPFSPNKTTDLSLWVMNPEGSHVPNLSAFWRTFDDLHAQYRDKEDRVMRTSDLLIDTRTGQRSFVIPA